VQEEDDDESIPASIREYYSGFQCLDLMVKTIYYSDGKQVEVLFESVEQNSP